MLISDLALMEPPFRKYVELYVKDHEAFFVDFTKAWVKLQENGCTIPDCATQSENLTSIADCIEDEF
jgi:catalase (peroxidase I)